MQAVTIRNDFLRIKKVLKARVKDPKFYIMDNKCYGDLKQAMKKY